MENIRQFKECLEKYYDIDILAFKNLPDSWQAANALSLSLGKLNKNVNLLEAEKEALTAKQSPKSTNAPQADFLISIKEGGTKLSQLFYEKAGGSLNLFLKTDGKALKKEDILLQPLGFNKMLITLGIASAEKIKQADSQKPCLALNIDNKMENANFGDFNFIQQNISLSEMIFDFIESIDKGLFDQQIASRLATGIVQGTNKFQNANLTANTFQKIGFLSEKGADLKELLCSFEKTETAAGVKLFQKILLKLRFSLEKNFAWAALNHSDFLSSNSQPKDLKLALEKLNSGFLPVQNFFVLWEQNSSPLIVKGVFYCPQFPQKTQALLEKFPGLQKGNAALFSAKEANLQKTEEALLNLLNNNQ